MLKTWQITVALAKSTCQTSELTDRSMILRQSYILHVTEELCYCGYARGKLHVIPHKLGTSLVMFGQVGEVGDKKGKRNVTNSDSFLSKAHTSSRRVRTIVRTINIGSLRCAHTLLLCPTQKK